MRKITASQICFIAFGAVLNIAGSTLALSLRLPVYLDAIGTVLVAAVSGPFYGILPSIISGLISGITIDIYSLYFIPANAATGIMTGLLFKRITKNWFTLPAGNLLLVFPGSVIGAIIAAGLFGGVTSSGSSYIVQLLDKCGLNLTASVFAVQLITDYLDRFLALILVLETTKRIPKDILRLIKGGNTDEPIQQDNQ